MYKKRLSEKLTNLNSHERLLFLSKLRISDHSKISNIFERNGVLCLIIFTAGAKILTLQAKYQYSAKEKEFAENLKKLEEKVKSKILDPEKRDKILNAAKKSYNKQLNQKLAICDKYFKAQEFFEKEISDIIEISRTEESQQELLKFTEIQDFIFLLGEILNKEHAPADKTQANKEKYELYLKIYHTGLVFFDKKLQEIKKNENSFSHQNKEYQLTDLLENISFNLQDINVLEEQLVQELEKQGHVAFAENLLLQGISGEAYKKIQDYLNKTNIIYKAEENTLVEKFRQQMQFVKITKETDIKTIFDNTVWENKAISIIEIMRSAYGAFFDLFSDFLVKNKIIPGSEKKNVINRVAGNQRFTKKDKTSLLLSLYNKGIFSNADLDKLENRFKMYILDKTKQYALNIINEYYENKLEKGNKLVLAAALANKQYAEKGVLELLNKKYITHEEIDQLSQIINRYKPENSILYLQEIITYIFSLENKSSNDAFEAVKAILGYIHQKYYPIFIDYLKFISNKNFKDFIQIVRNSLFEKNDREMNVVYELFYSIFENEFNKITNRSAGKNHFAENLSIRYLTEPLPEKKWANQAKKKASIVAQL